jgi:hypothetical protein
VGATASHGLTLGSSGRLIAGALEGGQGRTGVPRARPGIVADAVQLSPRSISRTAPHRRIPTGLAGPVTQRRQRRCAFILVRGTGSIQERGV